MDPLSALSSIAGLVVMGTKIGLQITSAIDDARALPSDLQRLATELNTLCTILTRLEHVLEPSTHALTSTFTSTSTVPLPPSSLSDLSLIFSALQDLFVALSRTVDKLRGSSNALSRHVRWLRAEKSIAALRADIEKYKSTLQITLLLAPRRPDDATAMQGADSGGGVDIKSLIRECLREVGRGREDRGWGRKSMNEGDRVLERFLLETECYADAVLEEGRAPPPEYSLVEDDKRPPVPKIPKRHSRNSSNGSGAGKAKLITGQKKKVDLTPYSRGAVLSATTNTLNTLCQSLPKQVTITTQTPTLLLLGSTPTHRDLLLRRLKLHDTADPLHAAELTLLKSQITDLLVGAMTRVLARMNAPTLAPPLHPTTHLPGGSGATDPIVSLHQKTLHNPSLADSERLGAVGALSRRPGVFQALHAYRRALHVSPAPAGCVAPDAESYFLTHLARVCTASWTPSDKDVLHAPLERLGLLSVSVGAMTVVDVTDVRPGRRVVPPEDVRAVVFLVQLRTYVEPRGEQGRDVARNVLRAEMERWRTVVASETWRNTDVIGVFDVGGLQDVVDVFGVEDYWPEYSGQKDVARYLAHQFEKIVEREGKEREFWCVFVDGMEKWEVEQMEREEREEVVVDIFGLPEKGKAKAKWQRVDVLKELGDSVLRGQIRAWARRVEKEQASGGHWLDALAAAR